MSSHIYLDYNATSPLRASAKQALEHCLEWPYNASSVHYYGRKAHDLKEDARKAIAELVGSTTSQIVFNSGATEANNTVLQHFSQERIIMSAIEHPSCTQAAPHALPLQTLKNGTIDLNRLEDLLAQEKTTLVSIMFVNNETGVIQPIKEASELAQKYGAFFHCDAVQAAGRFPINIEELGIDFLSLSSHKIGGMQGSGALIFGSKNCLDTPILLHGGGQEKKRRAGTENLPSIVCFGMAAQEALQEAQKKHPKNQEIQKLQIYLERELVKITPEIVIHGKDSSRIPHCSLFSYPGRSSETLLMGLDLEGIALSNGSACSSGKVHSSPVLKAMGIEENIAKAALRISLGWNSHQEDIDSFLEAWKKVVAKLT